MTSVGQRKTRIGLFGIGLDTYWPQFDGLLDRLTGYQREIAERLRGRDIDLVDAGMVDNPVKAREAASLFRREEVDLIFLYISTYALSSTVLPVVQHTRVPVVVLNLQPVPHRFFSPPAFGHVPETPDPACDGPAEALGLRVPLEHPSILELQHIEARLFGRCIERAHLGEKGFGLLELLQDEFQELRVVHACGELFRDAPKLQESLVEPDQLAVHVHHQDSVRCGFERGAKHGDRVPQRLLGPFS